MPVIYVALGANAAVFSLWKAAEWRRGPPWLPRFLADHTYCSMAQLRSLRMHTLLTSAFSHKGPLHLIGNAYGLALFGGVAAQALTPRELGVLLLSCGVSSSACHAFCHPRNTVLGASGMLMGVLTAAALLEPGRRFHMILPVPGMTFSLLQVADLTLAANLLGFFVLRRHLGLVSWASHIGGTSAGLGFACGAWLRGDARFAHPWRVHVDRFAEDWHRTAESAETAPERVAVILDKLGIT